ncbi:MAG: hypothetical protein RL071_695 [Pseudomonadota bacterium]
MHVYRWDLDKTYLETDFHSLRGLLRSATEPARDKVTAPGAAAILRALSGVEENHIVIVSGSPTQLRPVLEEKLRLDGVRFDELILKDSLDKLKRGQVRSIRGQLGYKLPQLLRLRVGWAPQAPETLFGDDAEVDAIVYALYADALAGRLTGKQVAKAMREGGAYDDEVDDAMGALARNVHSDAVARIFIRLTAGCSPTRFAPLRGRVVPIHSWLQAALVLYEDGQLPAAAVLESAAEVLAAGLDAFMVSSLVQDIVRRGFIRKETPAGLDWPDALQPALRLALERTPDGPRVRPAGVPEGPLDYVQIIKGWRASA